jgi:alpha-L-fucosidase
LSRLQALGAWLQQNGEAIYGSHPWSRAMGQTAAGIPVRFTQKETAVSGTRLGSPKTGSVTVKLLSPQTGQAIYLRGNDKPLSWSPQGEDIRVKLPPALPGRYAYVLRITGFRS